MKTSEKGIELVISFEGFSKKACKCVPTEKYYTIGYGHYGKDVARDATITKKDAIALLKKDLISFEKKVDKYNHIYHFSQNEFDALVSFCYNVGNIDKLTVNGRRSKSEKNCADLFDVEQWNVSYFYLTVVQDTIQSMSAPTKILMSFSAKSVLNQNILVRIQRENLLLM